jgi:hypothetical protein
MELVGAVLRVQPDVPVLLERDANFGSFAELRAELAALSRLRPTSSLTSSHALPAPRTVSDDDAPALFALQVELAGLLTDVKPVSSALSTSLGPHALARARALLERKRVDDAMPLLSRLSGRGRELRSLAERVVRTQPRAARGAGPIDALHIARAAQHDDTLHDDATHDALLLRARFRGNARAGSVVPRIAPFVGRAQLRSGARLTVWKGFGPFAPVHLRESQLHVEERP